MSGRSAGNDQLLARIVGRNDSSTDRMIEELLERHATPRVDAFLANEVWRGELAQAELQDLRNDITLRLLRKLRHLASSRFEEPIVSFADYVNATAHNACEDHRRRRDPLRRRLAARVRYVLTHTRQLAVWGRDPVLCGLVSWRERPDIVPVVAPEPMDASVTHDAKALRRLLETMLQQAGGPVELSALVATLAAAVGLPVEPFVPAETLIPLGFEDGPLARMEEREYLVRLWQEIAALPVRQRRALLLQLRLDDGESVAHVLAALGLVSVRRQAEALEMPLSRWLELWNELPLDDRRIASMLDLTRQQVINLRKSARERLARRMGRDR